MLVGALFDLLNTDLLRIRQSKRQLVTVDLKFHGISQRGKLYHGYLSAGDHSHIKKVLAKRSLTTYLRDDCALADLQFS